jgi:predicted porin
LDAVSVAVDWRFARHVDVYAGVMWAQKQNGLASGAVLTATNPAVAATYNTFNKISTFDPGVGLRYQF